jgi:hypothetical protein
MSIMNVVRRCRPAAARPVTAGLAATGLVAASLAAAGLAIAPAAQATSTARARAAAGGLHVVGTINLGPASTFSYVLGEAPNGDVYYAQGSIVYRVSGDNAPVKWLQASGTVQAVAANKSDLIVDVGRTVSAYALSSGHRLRTWKLPSIAKVTSAGLFAVGRHTVYAYTDWATDESGFEYANVDRMSLSSPAVHRVTKNNAYPADLAANAAGVYYEGIKGSKDYLFRAPPSGSVRRHGDANIDAPLALSAGNV